MVSEQWKFTYAAALSGAGEVNEVTPTSESPVHPNLTVPQRNLSPQVQRNYVEEVDNPLIINRNDGPCAILVNPQRIPINPQRIILIHPQRMHSNKADARSPVRSASSMIPQRNLSSEQQISVADPQRKAIQGICTSLPIIHSPVQVKDLVRAGLAPEEVALLEAELKDAIAGLRKQIPDVVSLRKQIPRFEKLLKSESFRAKAALLTLIGSEIAVGAASNQQVVRNLVPRLAKFVSSEDWATRKASDEARLRLGVAERETLSEKHYPVKSVYNDVDVVLESEKITSKSPSVMVIRVFSLIFSPDVMASKKGLSGGNAIRHLKCSQNLEDFQSVDIVIEAIVESESVKKNLFVVCSTQVIGNAVEFDETRTLWPYKWAQYLAGIDFLPEVSPLLGGSKSSNEETAKQSTVISGLSMYRQQNRLQIVVQRIRARKKARLALAEQFDSLMKLEWPVLACKNVSWTSHNPRCSLHGWSSLGSACNEASSVPAVDSETVQGPDVSIEVRSDTSKEEVENTRKDEELPSLTLATAGVNDANPSPTKGTNSDRSRKLSFISKCAISPLNKGKSPSFKKHEEDVDLIMEYDSELDEPAQVEHDTDLELHHSFVAKLGM